MNHRELVDAITSAATQRGYWWWVNEDRSPRQQAGWIDVVVLGFGHAWFIEVKSEDGRRTASQVRVGALLEHAGLRYRVVRPSTLTGFVEELSPPPVGRAGAT